MQVYQKLKKLRQSLGLRQVDMASGVVDVSFYSRIERGEVKIRAINLIEILQAQNVSLISFMKDFGLVETENQFWRNTATAAFLHGDSAALKQIEQDPKNLSSLRIKQVISLMIAKLDHKLLEIDPQIEADLRRCIFGIDSWDADTLKILAMITVNYMKMCLKERNGKTEFQLTEKFLNALPATDDIFLEKCAGAYFKAKQVKNVQEQKRITSLLSNSGYSYYVDNFMKPAAL